MRKIFFYSLLSGLMLSFGFCYGQSAANLLEQSSEVHPLVVQYGADYGSLERFYFVTNSTERRERFKTFHQDYLKRLQELPFESMSTGGKVDYLLMKRDL